MKNIKILSLIMLCVSMYIHAMMPDHIYEIHNDEMVEAWIASQSQVQEAQKESESEEEVVEGKAADKHRAELVAMKSWLRYMAKRYQAKL